MCIACKIRKVTDFLLIFERNQAYNNAAHQFIVGEITFIMRRHSPPRKRSAKLIRRDAHGVKISQQNFIELHSITKYCRSKTLTSIF